MGVRGEFLRFRRRDFLVLFVLFVSFFFFCFCFWVFLYFLVEGRTFFSLSLLLVFWQSPWGECRFIEFIYVFYLFVISKVFWESTQGECPNDNSTTNDSKRICSERVFWESPWGEYQKVSVSVKKSGSKSEGRAWCFCFFWPTKEKTMKNIKHDSI